MQSIPLDREAEYATKLLFVAEKYAIMYLLGRATGLRISEILSIRVKDYNKTLKVYQSKTKKTKIAEIPPKLHDTITEYIKRNHLKAKHALIPSVSWRKEKPLSRTQAYIIMRRTASEIGLNSTGTHSMRKTHAKVIYAETGQISAVQEALGHTHLDTTIRYLVNLDEILKTALT